MSNLALSENKWLKSLVILAGAVVGFVEGLKLLGLPAAPITSAPGLTLDSVASKQQELEAQFAAMEGQTGDVVDRIAHIERMIDSAVSGADLQLSIDQAVDKAVDQAVRQTWDRLKEIEDTVEERFSSTERSAEVLRVMIADTDQMLERVLEGLDLLAETQLTGSRARD